MDCPHETHTADCIHLYDTGAKCYLEEGEEGGREGRVGRGGREGGRGGREGREGREGGREGRKVRREGGRGGREGGNGTEKYSVIIVYGISCFFCSFSFSSSPSLPSKTAKFNGLYIVHGVQKIESAQKFYASRG